jgi:hypothetical protein
MTVTFVGGTIAAELVTGVPLLFLIALRVDAGAIGASRAMVRVVDPRDAGAMAAAFVVSRHAPTRRRSDRLSSS